MQHVTDVAERKFNPNPTLLPKSIQGVTVLSPAMLAETVLV